MLSKRSQAAKHTDCEILTRSGSESAENSSLPLGSPYVEERGDGGKLVGGGLGAASNTLFLDWVLLTQVYSVCEYSSADAGHTCTGLDFIFQ